MAQDDQIRRLAREIDAARKAEHFLVNAGEVAKLRRQGAAELHQICSGFVSSVNSNLPEPVLALSPATYEPESFRETGVNLFQIGSQGRQVQLAFEAPPKLFSTEKFLVPYVLEGEIRAYNQQMLERFEVRSQLLFYCVEQGTVGWRYFDWRTRHTGPVSPDMLVGIMEPLY
jgi:hypothetical protein